MSWGLRSRTSYSQIVGLSLGAAGAPEKEQVVRHLGLDQIC